MTLLHIVSEEEATGKVKALFAEAAWAIDDIPAPAIDIEMLNCRRQAHSPRRSMRPRRHRHTPPAANAPYDNGHWQAYRSKPMVSLHPFIREDPALKSYWASLSFSSCPPYLRTLFEIMRPAIMTKDHKRGYFFGKHHFFLDTVSCFIVSILYCLNNTIFNQ